jgi:tyrosine-protein phosphatase SIW14
MSQFRSRLFALSLTAALTLGAVPGALAAGRAAGSSSQIAALSAIRIDNFGVVNDNYYRGAQPRGDDYRDLAALGVKTVLDLTREGRDDEQALVEAAGMKFHRIPLTTTDRPSDAAIAEFLSIVNDPANQPVYVHCQGGRHRTGTMTAVYRMTQDHWTAAQAYDEMKQYRFEGFPGHPELKNFVMHFTPSALAPAALSASAAKPATATVATTPTPSVTASAGQ